MRVFQDGNIQTRRALRQGIVERNVIEADDNRDFHHISCLLEIDLTLAVASVHDRRNRRRKASALVTGDLPLDAMGRCDLTRAAAYIILLSEDSQSCAARNSSTTSRQAAVSSTCGMWLDFGKIAQRTLAMRSAKGWTTASVASS